MAGLFGLFILWREGGQAALEYYTGYLIEFSLSVDNLFVFILIFSYFGVPAAAQPKVLNWGILGAIVMRFFMIALGAILLQRFEWIIYVFGGILVITGVRMMLQKDTHVDLEKNPVVRLARRVLPFSDCYDGTRFLTRTVRGKVLATPLLLVLLVIGVWSFLLARTKIGRYIYAIGANPEAARRAGINVPWVRTIAFMLCSFTGGLAGLVYASRLGSIATDIEVGNFVLYAVAAAVIGGTSLFGGRGKMLHALLGGMVIAVVFNGLALMGISAAGQDIATAIVLILAVTVDSLVRRRGPTST